LQQQELS
jgi:predicted DNA-binding protein (MmcQ/YjbR family)